MTLPAIRPALLLAPAGGIVLLAAVAGGLESGVALRASAVVLLFVLGALAVRHARVTPAQLSILSIVERRQLARETGVAVVAIGEHRLVLGYGPTGVALLLDLGLGPGPGPGPEREEHAP